MMTTLKLSCLAFMTLIGCAHAQTCREVIHATLAYTVCEAPAEADLRLWLTGPDGRPMGTFDRVREQLESAGHTLAFAMNAGMYHPDRAPVGLYIEDRQQNTPVVTSAGPGNFGMLPNGVFCITDTGFGVPETVGFTENPPDCRYARQSGPMLVIEGDLHPRFLPDATSRFVRNGVGVSANGETAWFAISAQPVTFHEFAGLFRDALGAPNALYFDGRVSRLYAPELERDDTGFPMGPIVGLVVPVDDEAALR